MHHNFGANEDVLCVKIIRIEILYNTVYVYRNRGNDILHQLKMAAI